MSEFHAQKHIFWTSDDLTPTVEINASQGYAKVALG